MQIQTSIGDDLIYINPHDKLSANTGSERSFIGPDCEEHIRQLSNKVLRRLKHRSNECLVFW